MRRVLFVSSLGLIALLYLLVPTSAQSKSLYWDRFDVDVTVLPDGDLQVVETQQITFLGGPFHYGYRVVPKNRLDNITDVQVWEGDRRYQSARSQSDYTFFANWSDEGLSIRWYFPYTSDSTHTFVISYKVQGAVRRYPEGDEVWWKAIPDDRDYPIRDARVSIDLPEGATINLSDDGDGFVAETDGVSAELMVGQDRRSVVAAANEQLGAKETLAVGIKFTPGVVGGDKPGWQDDYDRKVEWNNTNRPTANLIAGVLGLLVLVGAPLGIYLLWYTRGRDPHVGLVVDVLSEPPSDLPPGAAGTLLDETADMEDVVATLIDLARRGYLTMSEEGEKKFGGIIFRQDFSFARTNKEWRGQGLRHYERELLKGLFGSRKERKLSKLKNKFYRHVPEIKKGLYETIVQAGYFSASPDKVRKRYVGVGIALAVIVVGAGILATIAAIEWVDAIWCPFVGLVLGGVGLIVGSQVMPAKTKKGAEAAARWNAFKRYLQQIQDYTDLEQATELFETYLPYAIAFGLERSWVNKFARVETTPIPTWYHPYWMTGHSQSGRRRSPGEAGSGPSVQEMSDSMAGGFQRMSDGLVNMFNSVGNTLSSQPSSSSSGGGFSGGGFSGGGSSGGGSAGFG